MSPTVACADYTPDYESSDATIVDENDLEKSLREILPSEGHRMKVQQESFLDTSPRADADVTDGELHLGADDSFTRFNIVMVQQYFREEAVHQQHKHMMLLLRERALKEKTAMELAWLAQQQQQHHDKGSDDKHPDIICKQKNVIRAHRRAKNELRRLQKASKLSLEAQQLMLKESNDISHLQRDMLRVREKLRKAGVEPATIPSVDSIVSGSDRNITSRSDEDDDSSYLAGVGAEPASKGKALPKLKLDKKYLTAREQQLRERRDRLMEQLDVDEKLKEKECEIEQLELEKRTLQKSYSDQKYSTGLWFCLFNNLELCIFCNVCYYDFYA